MKKIGYEKHYGGLYNNYNPESGYSQHLVVRVVLTVAVSLY